MIAPEEMYEQQNYDSPSKDANPLLSFSPNQMHQVEYDSMDNQEDMSMVAENGYAQSKLDDKIKILENMVIDLKSTEKSRRGVQVDDKKLRSDLQAAKSTIEEFKSTYPVENQQDERVNETVEAYEKLVDHRIKQLEKSAMQPKPDQQKYVDEMVRVRMEEDERLVIDEAQYAINEMKKSNLGGGDKPGRSSAVQAISPQYGEIRKSVMRDTYAVPNHAKSHFLEPTDNRGRLTKQGSSALDTPATNRTLERQPGISFEPVREPARKPENETLKRSVLVERAFAPKKNPSNGIATSTPPGAFGSNQPKKSNLVADPKHTPRGGTRTPPDRQEAFAPQQSTVMGMREEKADSFNPYISKGPKGYGQQQPSGNSNSKSKSPAFKDTYNQKSNLFNPQYDDDSEDSLDSVYAREQAEAEKPGVFIKNAVLSQGQGAITVIKIIKEVVLAVGYSSGELAYYSLADDFKFLSKYKEHTSSVSALESADLVFSTGGSMKNKEVLISGGNERDKTIVIWDVSTFQPIKRLKGHEHMITSIIDLHDTCTIVTGSMDSKIAFWDLREEEPECIQILDDMRFPVIVMEYDMDDGILTAGTLDGQIGIWQVYMENGMYVGCALTRVLSLEAHVLDILRSACLPKSIITLESDFCIREYDLGSGKLLKTVRADKPLIDLFVIEGQGGQIPTIFAIDNAKNLHRIANWHETGKTLMLPPTGESEVNIKRYIGFNPKSQIFISNNDLLLLAADQTNQTVSVTRLNLIH